MASCKKEEPVFGMITLKHVENDSLYSLVQIPNAFTPDGDGTNDVFRIFASGLNEDEFELTINNKDGEIIFHTLLPKIGWDATYKGVKAASGTYFLHLWAKDYTGFIYNYSGKVYLLR
jgi:gliding motility-associated-like protein